MLRSGTIEVEAREIDPSQQPEHLTPAARKVPEVSIIIPARNEEASLDACLRSLTTQDGVTHEIIVVDDGSTDRTREIAEGFAGVRVRSAGPLPDGWTGKNNAIRAGAADARGKWLLLTDADTEHLPGSLARAMLEAERENADLLSYSPQQIVETLSERAVMPVVFAELAAQYPPAKVRDQQSGIVAANGQYILVRRTSYEQVGGHAAVAAEILEDVALAREFRKRGLRILFRYGGDAVKTRMYRNWTQLRDGWTKNLALLFPQPEWRAAWLFTWWMLAWLTVPIPLLAGWLFKRILRAHFHWKNTLLAATFGVPVFSYLMLRSARAHAAGAISWKGREYRRAGKDIVLGRGTASSLRDRNLTTDN